MTNLLTPSPQAGSQPGFESIFSGARCSKGSKGSQRLKSLRSLGGLKLSNGNMVLCILAWRHLGETLTFSIPNLETHCPIDATGFLSFFGSSLACQGFRPFGFGSLGVFEPANTFVTWPNTFYSAKLRTSWVSMIYAALAVRGSPQTLSVRDTRLLLFLHQSLLNFLRRNMKSRAQHTMGYEL